MDEVSTAGDLVMNSSTVYTYQNRRLTQFKTTRDGGPTSVFDVAQEYDARGNVVRQTLSTNGTVLSETVTEYDQFDQPTTVRSTISMVTTEATSEYEYEGERLVRVTQRVMNPDLTTTTTTTFSYDANGKVIGSVGTDGDGGNEVRCVHDGEVDQPLECTGELFESSYTYDVFGNVIETTTISQGGDVVNTMTADYSCWETGARDVVDGVALTNEDVIPNCTTDAECGTGQFCAVECFVGDCRGGGRVEDESIVGFCQPCVECEIDEDSVSGSCAACQ